jgi:hypothetical protein
VSFENIFDSKQPKLEPKLVSALSETKRLFRLFRFNTETESFDVSIEPKQTEDQPKQFDREHILRIFTENLGFFRIFFETNRRPTQESIFGYFSEKSCGIEPLKGYEWCVSQSLQNRTVGAIEVVFVKI